MSDSGSINVFELAGHSFNSRMDELPSTSLYAQTPSSSEAPHHSLSTPPSSSPDRSSSRQVGLGNTGSPPPMHTPRTLARGSMSLEDILAYKHIPEAPQPSQATGLTAEVACEGEGQPTLSTPSRRRRPPPTPSTSSSKYLHSTTPQTSVNPLSSLSARKPTPAVESSSSTLPPMHPFTPIKQLPIPESGWCIAALLFYVTPPSHMFLTSTITASLSNSLGVLDEQVKVMGHTPISPTSKTTLLHTSFSVPNGRLVDVMVMDLPDYQSSVDALDNLRDIASSTELPSGCKVGVLHSVSCDYSHLTDVESAIASTGVLANLSQIDVAMLTGRACALVQCMSESSQKPSRKGNAARGSPEEQQQLISKLRAAVRVRDEKIKVLQSSAHKSSELAPLLSEAKKNSDARRQMLEMERESLKLQVNALTAQLTTKLQSPVQSPTEEVKVDVSTPPRAQIDILREGDPKLREMWFSTASLIDLLEYSLARRILTEEAINEVAEKSAEGTSFRDEFEQWVKRAERLEWKRLEESATLIQTVARGKRDKSTFGRQRSAALTIQTNIRRRNTNRRIERLTQVSRVRRLVHRLMISEVELDDMMAQCECGGEVDLDTLEEMLQQRLDASPADRTARVVDELQELVALDVLSPEDAQEMIASCETEDGSVDFERLQLAYAHLRNAIHHSEDADP